MERFVDIQEAQASLAELIARLGPTGSIVITKNGQPLARLLPSNAAAEHRAMGNRYGVTLPPEFEPGDARIARLMRDSEVPYRLRPLPRH